MGNCFSDPSGKPKHGGQKLGSGPAPTSVAQPQPAAAGAKPKQTNSEPPRTLGGFSTTGPGGSGGGDAAARERALQAAEERANAVSLARRVSMRRVGLAQAKHTEMGSDVVDANNRPRRRA